MLLTGRHLLARRTRLSVGMLCLAGFFGVLRTGDSQRLQQTFQRISELPSAGKRVTYLRFFNEKEGVLANSEALWRTTDSGTTWQMGWNHRSRSSDGPRFQFTGAKEGWMLLHERFYRTLDGGREWTELPVGSAENIRLSTFGMATGGKSGWLGGQSLQPISLNQWEQLPKHERTEQNKQTYRFDAVVFRTDDGGLSWRQQKVPSLEGGVQSIFLYERFRGLVLGLWHVAYTVDGGEHWQSSIYRPECFDRASWHETADERFPIYAFFLNRDLVWLSYRDGYMARSADGGISWCDWLQVNQLPFVRPYQFFNTFFFVNEQESYGLGSDGSVYRTVDRGKTWNKIEGITDAEYLYVLDSRRIWAAGKSGVARLSVN